MNANKLSYIILLLHEKRPHCLLWQEGSDTPDTLVLSPGETRFLLEKTDTGIRRAASDIDLKIAKQKPTCWDLDHIFGTLSELLPDKPIAVETCSLFLNVWNGLEDMAYSVGCFPNAPDGGIDHRPNKEYEKLFLGNNLPSITPKGKSYNPVFTSDEISEIVKYLSALWNRIVKITGQFSEQSTE